MDISYRFDPHQRGWTSNDPRLALPYREGDRFVLDQPPYHADVTEETLYAPRPLYRTGGGKRYDELQGQQYYYVNPSLARPFIPELFDEPSTIVKRIYVDPMSVSKAEYVRHSAIHPETQRLSWITDSQFQRQDIMARQAWRRNQQDGGFNRHYG